MYERGVLIMYGSSGVCRVEDVAPMKGSRGAEKNRLYYKLSPVYGSGTIYVPVDTKIFMRPVLSRREAMDLIHRIPEISDDCGEDVSDWHALSAIYQEQLHSHDCAELVHLIKSVYLKNRTNAESGRRPYKSETGGRTSAQRTGCRAEHSLGAGIKFYCRRSGSGILEKSAP